MPNSKPHVHPTSESGNAAKLLVMRRSEKFRVRCSACGKVTAARLPRHGKHKGDGTFWFPRRHKISGVDCRGNIEEAEMIECYGA